MNIKTAVTALFLTTALTSPALAGLMSYEWTFAIIYVTETQNMPEKKARSILNNDPSYQADVIELGYLACDYANSMKRANYSQSRIVEEFRRKDMYDLYRLSQIYLCNK